MQYLIYYTVSFFVCTKVNIIFGLKSILDYIKLLISLRDFTHGIFSSFIGKYHYHCYHYY